MSQYIVSARKYRPTRFDEVVGQEHVSQTLKNALQKDQLAHAFLFCGPRGVGKTTCARILAKVLNCENRTKDFEPCNTCNSCQAFNDSASFNITELDAASNNSVEHIRALIEQVRFQPQEGKFKIFIIDEVHMLSQQAFNAFLKTLEEPPPYAVFILATTEKHKIIPTILSRCQIFDFKRIQVSEMVKHMESICKSEGIKAEKKALHVIAQKADGALRDALSIFDRISGFSGKKVTYEGVIQNLNILDYDYYFKLTDTLLAGDMAQCLLLLNEIIANGFEPNTIINGLAAHFRDLLVCRDPVTIPLLEVSEDLREKYKNQSRLAKESFLLSALNLANECDIHYKTARNKRLHVEMTVIKMANLQHLIKLAGQPQELEKKTPDQSIKTEEKPKNLETASSPSPEERPAGETDKEPPAAKEILPEEPPQPQVTEKKKPPVKTSSKHAMPKLTSLASLEEELGDSSTEEEDDSKPLSLENVKKYWLEYTESHPSPSLKTAVKKAQLSLEPERKIVVRVGSAVYKNLLAQEKELMPFLKSKIGANNLELTIEIDPTLAEKAPPPNPKKMWTVKEKYDKMMEGNPLIQELRKRFDLKIDHD